MSTAEEAGTLSAADLTAAIAKHSESKEWPAAFDTVLSEVAGTGQSHFEWSAVKAVLVAKLEAVAADFAEKQDLKEPYDDMLKRLLALLLDFPNAPFTVQRLAEVLSNPRRVYSSARKLFRAVEKLLTISSTIPLKFSVAAPKDASYQESSENGLSKLVGGVGTAAAADSTTGMDVG
jgi:hypothetical protein